MLYFSLRQALSKGTNDEPRWSASSVSGLHHLAHIDAREHRCTRHKGIVAQKYSLGFTLRII
jgi:hypothetical protein